MGTGALAFRDADCPWTSSKGVERMRIAPRSGPVEGALTIPGSKSYTNRALILAAAAHGTSRLSGVLRSEDSYWCIDALRSLGATIEVQGDRVTVQGRGGVWQPTDEIFLGSAGTAARFLCSVLAMSVDTPVCATATEQLSQRPMRALFEALRQIGARFAFPGQEWHLPVRLCPTDDTGGEVEISGAISSQFISGLLMGAPLARQPVQLTVRDGIVQENYVRMTLATMRAFGAPVTESPDLARFSIAPGAYRGCDHAIEADASTASYFMALAAASGGRMVLRNLTRATLQPDIQVLSVLETMGCTVGEHEGGLLVSGPGELRGGFTVDMNQFSDTALTIAAIAPFASAPIRITGVAHIRKHESDRLAVMADSLERAGVRVIEHDDGLTIHPGSPRRCVLPTHDDHRVTMSLAVLGAMGAGIDLDDPGSVSKTCPDFFAYLETLGIHSSPARA